MGLLALAAVLVYRNSLAGAFVFDDYAWIVSNANIRHLWPIWQVLFPHNMATAAGRPLVSLTLAVNYALGGADVWGYHVLNLAIHVLAAWTLFGIVRRTLLLPRYRKQFVSAATPLALIGAMLWMIHPLQTESVCYIIQRAESLMGLLYLLTLYCVIRGADSSRSTLWYGAAVAACLAGMGAKEVMVTAPVIIMLYDRTFLAGSFREALRRRWSLYVAMAATWAVVVLLLISTGFYRGSTGFAVQKYTWWSYLLTQSSVLLHYLRLAFWPSGLCFDYNWPPAQSVREVVLPGILILGLLALTLWALVRRPAWGFLGVWFFMILAPTSSFVPIQDAAFEHRMYLSLAAVVTGVVVSGWLAGQWLIRRRMISQRTLWAAGGLLAAFVGIMLGMLTSQRNADYESTLTLWQDTVAKAPHNDRAEINLGMALANRDQFDEAIAHYQKALELNPDRAETHCNFGSALSRLGRVEEATSHFQKAIELDPHFAMPHYNLALVLVDSGHADEAKVQFQTALELNPDYAEAHLGLASILEESGRVDEATTHYRQALEINPDYTEAHYNFGLTLAGRGQMDEAIAQYQQALKIEPDFADAHNNLANALVGCGRVDEAIAHYRKVLEIKPDFAEGHNNLGLVLARQNQLEDAITHFRRALEIKPDFADAGKNLAIALRHKGHAD